MAGRDLEAIAQGLLETTQEDYLRQRIEQVQYLHALLKEVGVTLMHPCGGHAVYVDARSYISSIPLEEYRGLTLSLALFVRYGIRTCEIGDFMYGKKNQQGQLLEPAKNDFVRLAIPRLTYSAEHMLYTAACFAEFNSIKDQLVRGVRPSEKIENNGFDHFFASFSLVDRENFKDVVLA